MNSPPTNPVTSTPQRPYSKSLVGAFICIYFFIHVMLYSSHNFREILAKKVFGISPKEYSYIEMASVIKLIGSVGGAWIAQKSVRPLYISLIASAAFVFTLGMLIMQVAENMWANIALGIIHIISDAAILPTIDAECLSLLAKDGSSEKFGVIRMFSTLGHAITYPINHFIKTGISKDDDNAISPRSILLNTAMSGAISVLSIIVAILTLKKPVLQKKTPATPQYMFSLLPTPFIVVLVCALGSGMSRSSLQSYLSSYLITDPKIQGGIHYIYFFRTMCELFVWSLVIWTGDRLSLEFLFPVALVLGSVRALCYTFKSQSSWVSMVLPYMAESLKSAYSALFIYVSTKLTFRYAKEEQKILAQGLFTGVYSGIAPFLAGLLSRHLFSNEEPGTGQQEKHTENLETLFFIVGTIGVASACLSSIYFFWRYKAKHRYLI
ncbi:hypothetical protein NEDG_01989 [Nematocida displodere]|uniref:Major facilitator superfamily associated domain-containing protein n=1 Tax=Nematocida displodere TaxID=1805483 RepID=A0A177EER2_9MICR|nr:hypothetical protein NEDG_01989 [Nematocida displodere]